MIPVSVVGVRVEVPTNQPIVLLREENGDNRFLPIFIGPPEATAIVYAMQGLEVPRPMTHDLFTQVLGELSMPLRKVEITDLSEGTFYAEVEFGDDKQVLRMSARPSDAIALAVRSEKPVEILAAEDVLEEAGVVFETEQDEAEVERFREFLDQITPEDFAEGQGPQGQG